MVRTIILLASLLLCTPLVSQPGPRTYTAPANAYTLRLPPGWTAEPGQSDLGHMMGFRAEHGVIAILTSPIPDLSRFGPAARDRYRTDLSRAYFDGWVSVLRANQGAVRVGRVSRTRLLGEDALRLEVTYVRREGRVPRRGYAVFFFSGPRAYFMTVAGDTRSFASVRQVAGTLRI